MHVPTWAITVIATKKAFPAKTNQTKFANVIANPLLCIESPCLWIVPTISKLSEKTENSVLLFLINFMYEDVQIEKSLNLAYLVPAQYEPLSANDENTDSDNVIHNISTTASEPEVKMLPPIPINSKMIFPGDHTPVKKLCCKMPKFQKPLMRN